MTVSEDELLQIVQEAIDYTLPFPYDTLTPIYEIIKYWKKYSAYQGFQYPKNAAPVRHCYDYSTAIVNYLQKYGDVIKANLIAAKYNNSPDYNHIGVGIYKQNGELLCLADPTMYYKKPITLDIKEQPLQYLKHPMTLSFSSAKENNILEFKKAGKFFSKEIIYSLDPRLPVHIRTSVRMTINSLATLPRFTHCRVKEEDQRIEKLTYSKTKKKFFINDRVVNVRSPKIRAMICSLHESLLEIVDFISSFTDAEMDHTIYSAQEYIRYLHEQEAVLAKL